MLSTIMYTHICTRTLCNQYTQWNALLTTAIFIIIQKRKENIYTKKRLKQIINWCKRRKEREKSNEAAIRRFFKARVQTSTCLESGIHKVSGIIQGL